MAPGPEYIGVGRGHPELDSNATPGEWITIAKLATMRSVVHGEAIVIHLVSSEWSGWMGTFAGKGKVAVLKTTPATVVTDVERVMDMAGVREALPRGVTTGLKINISWQTWYPACSSTPWQIEGAILGLRHAGYDDIVGIHNDTVVVDTRVGEANNKHKFVTDKYGVPCIYLYEQKFDWFRYEPKRPLLVLDKVYREGVLHPQGVGR